MAATDSKNNNFNLIRLAAAFAVLVSHSYALLGIAQPQLLGVNLGALAVDVFFVTSGYLVTASVMRRPLLQFVAARMLRIYPALFVCCALTALLLAGDLATGWAYFWKNALMLPGAPSTMPGAFDANPVTGVNGSLWTLPYEVRMYAGLAALWAVSAFKPVVFKVLTPVIAAIALAADIALGWTITHLAWMFFAGAALYVLRAPVVWWVAGLVAVVAVALPTVALPYLVIAAAYLPRASFFKGDYSYGVYIYAFPVQQSLVALGVSSVAGVLVGATIITASLAWLSWHVVEERALALKDRRFKRPLLQMRTRRT